MLLVAQLVAGVLREVPGYERREMESQHEIDASQIEAYNTENGIWTINVGSLNLEFLLRDTATGAQHLRDHLLRENLGVIGLQEAPAWESLKESPSGAVFTQLGYEPVVESGGEGEAPAKPFLDMIYGDDGLAKAIENPEVPGGHSKTAPTRHQIRTTNLVNTVLVHTSMRGRVRKTGSVATQTKDLTVTISGQEYPIVPRSMVYAVIDPPDPGKALGKAPLIIGSTHLMGGRWEDSQQRWGTLQRYHQAQSCIDKMQREAAELGGAVAVVVGDLNAPTNYDDEAGQKYLKGIYEYTKSFPEWVEIWKAKGEVKGREMWSEYQTAPCKIFERGGWSTTHPMWSDDAFTQQYAQDPSSSALRAPFSSKIFGPVVDHVFSKSLSPGTKIEVKAGDSRLSYLLAFDSTKPLLGPPWGTPNNDLGVTDHQLLTATLTIDYELSPVSPESPRKNYGGYSASSPPEA